MRRCQGGVAAEINFRDRCKPTEMKPPLDRNEEGRFREIVFARNGLKDLILQPRLKRTNRRWIALEHTTRESINLILLELHRKKSCNPRTYSSSYLPAPMARRNRLCVICCTRGSGPWGRLQWDHGSVWPGGMLRSWHQKMVAALKTKLPFGPG